MNFEGQLTVMFKDLVPLAEEDLLQSSLRVQAFALLANGSTIEVYNDFLDSEAFNIGSVEIGEHESST